jgi:hypothetical protein
MISPKRQPRPRKRCLFCEIRHVKCDARQEPCRNCTQLEVPCIRWPVEHSAWLTESLGGNLERGSKAACLPADIKRELVLDCHQPNEHESILHDEQLGHSRTLDHDHPVLLAIISVLNSLRQPIETRQRRIENHRHHLTALRYLAGRLDGGQGHLDVVEKDAILRWAIVELAIADGSEGVPAWQVHFAGLRQLGILPLDHGFASEWAVLDRLTTSALSSIANLAPQIDDHASLTAKIREIDRRKLRSNILKMHRQLLLLRELRSQRFCVLQSGRDIDVCSGCSLSRWLAVDTCLLLTTRSLRGEGNLKVSPGKNAQASNDLRHSLIETIVIDAHALLRSCTGALPDRHTVQEYHPASERANMVAGLLVTYPLAVALRQCFEDSSIEHTIRRTLRAVGQECYLPCALSLALQGVEQRVLPCVEVADALLLLAASCRRDCRGES